MRKYAINGKFTTESMGGIQRYAYEILFELDKLAKGNDIQLVVPPSGRVSPLENIEVVAYGNSTGILWEQQDFNRYLKKSNRLSLNLCNTMPLGANDGVAVIHDICYKVKPEFYRGARNKASRSWHCKMYSHIIESRCPIVTVSNFSCEEIARVYGVDRGRITVIPSAWQHMNRPVSDESIIEKLGLSDKSYFFTVSSLAPNKNTRWIISVAELMPETQFVIAGSSKLAETFSRHSDNVIFPGKVLDEEAKALMSHCKAFLFPTIYEGFGLPPLEAASCGADIVVSDTPCMHEVYGMAATYIDPFRPTFVKISQMTGKERQSLLARYSWSSSAKKLGEMIFN